MWMGKMNQFFKAITLGTAMVATLSYAEDDAMQIAMLRMQNQITELQNKLAESSGQIESLEHDLKLLQDENAALKQKLAAASSNVSPASDSAKDKSDENAQTKSEEKKDTVALEKTSGSGNATITPSDNKAKGQSVSQPSAQEKAEYEAKHSDIFKVITQENQGLGGARNTGTAQAQGEYVTYLDSDDYVIDNAYAYLLERFCQDEPDVLCYDLCRIYTDGKALHDPNAQPDGDIIFDGDLHLEISGNSVGAGEIEITAVNNTYREMGKLKVELLKRGVQLNDLIYNIGLMRKYIESGNTDLVPAAHRNIDNFLNVYYRKIQKSERLTKDEWMRNRRLMKDYSFSKERRQEKCSIREKIMRWMCEWAGTSYVGYVLIYFFHHTFFDYVYHPLVIGRHRKRIKQQKGLG